MTRYTVKYEPDLQDYQALAAEGGFGRHSLEDILAFTDKVIERYGNAGLDTPHIIEVGPSREKTRSVISYYKVSPDQQLDQSGEIRHGAMVVPFVDMDIVLPSQGEEQEPQHVKCRSVITMTRGIKDKNFAKRYATLENMEQLDRTGLVKPFTGGLPGGSIEGFENNPAEGLKRECAEEWGLLGEKMPGEQPHALATVNAALKEYLPTDPAAFVPVNASLDIYQDNPLLAFGYAVNVSQQFRAHLKKAAEVNAHNAAYLEAPEGKAALDAWKASGANEIVSYRIRPVGEEEELDDVRTLLERALSDGGIDVERMRALPTAGEQFNALQGDDRRLALVKKLFWEPAENPGYTYPHEHAAVYAVEREGIDRYRMEPKQYALEDGTVLERGDIVRYVHSHLEELRQERVLECSEQGVRINLAPHHMERIKHMPKRTPPAQVDSITAAVPVMGLAKGRTI